MLSFRTVFTKTTKPEEKQMIFFHFYLPSYNLCFYYRIYDKAFKVKNNVFIFEIFCHNTGLFLSYIIRFLKIMKV